ncbi:MAG: class A beta-lactamase-related serine hydrolase, partial [Candidatus Aminicenantes bacterium]|nr:class A beta-lactamase-related serine hydrolase [Candidatus Aminicenantes bacterium]
MKRIAAVVLSVFVVFLMLCPLQGRQSTAPAQEGIKRLETRIQALLQDVDGVMGVAAKHLESREEFFINGDTAFPMASTFKVPIFVEVMAQISEGRFNLEDEIAIQKTDQHLGSGMLSDLDAPGIKLSVRNLINMMMMISDNSATDILLIKVDADNVNARLRTFGIKDINVARTCQELIMDIIGLDYEKLRG